MRILITGGAGNIGRELVRRALAAGNEVTVFDIPPANYEGLEGKEGITVVKGFVTDTEAMAQAVKGVDAVIHLAALMTHLSTDREKTMSVNVGGTKTVLDALKKRAATYSLSFPLRCPPTAGQLRIRRRSRLTIPRWAWTFTLKVRLKPKKLYWHPVCPTPFCVLPVSSYPSFMIPTPGSF